MGVSETGQRYSHTISRISTFDFLRIVGMVMIFLIMHGHTCHSLYQILEREA